MEEAYKRDPKPDKAARQTLVDQVALGEKEVQVGLKGAKSRRLLFFHRC